jgi:hypothetical protein
MIPGARGCCVLHSSPPSPIVGGGDDQRGLGGPRPVVLRRRVHCGIDAALVVGVFVAVGGRQGGGRVARGIPGRGEEEKYRGRKVQGGVEEAQRGQEEEEGGSGGGWARDGVPGAGGELGRGGHRWPGTGRLDDRAADAPPSRFKEGGLSSCHLSIVAPRRRSAMARKVGIRSKRIGVISR